MYINEKRLAGVNL